MSCTIPSITVESASITSGRSLHNVRPTENSRLLRRGVRRHSYDTYHQRSASNYSADMIYARVDLFLHELKRRMDELEKYRQETKVQLDTQLERGYQVLQDVRDSCSPYSGELLWGAAKQRAAMVVEILESKYNDLAPTKETLEQKAYANIKLMETWLNELEGRAATRRKELVDSGWKKVDDSINATIGMFEEGYDKARRAKDMMKDSISHALNRAAESRLIHYDDLPIPWRINPHIKRGYRFTESKIECVTSILLPSNETVNIWSHLIGLIIVLSIALYFYPASAAFPMYSKWDIFVAACFFAAACKCLICSCMWHTMNSIADQCLRDRFACVDYTGISMLVAASILSTEWTAFYCEPISRAVYMSATLVFGVAGTILPWQEWFNRSDMAWARVAFYVTLALTGFLPAIQLNMTRGPAWTYYFYAPIIKSVLVYFTGAIIYASRIPEKWWPGLFDYAGGSHNIWHLAVLGGILFHYTAMMEFFQGAFARSQEPGGCAVL